MTRTKPSRKGQPKQASRVKGGETKKGIKALPFAVIWHSGPICPNRISASPARAFFYFPEDLTCGPLQTSARVSNHDHDFARGGRRGNLGPWISHMRTGAGSSSGTNNNVPRHLARRSGWAASHRDGGAIRTRKWWWWCKGGEQQES
jgi:hypothetical protein